jgi:flagellar FliL protein
MAKRKEPLPEPDQGVETGNESGEVTPRTGSRLYLVILIPLVILSAAGGAWLAYSHYPKLLQTIGMSGLKWVVAEEGKKDEPIRYGQFIELTDLIVNPAYSGGKRYLMLSVGIESEKSSTLEELSTKEIVVRDTILKVVGQYTVEELADINLRTEIKGQIRGAINSIVTEGEVSRVYLTRWVLQ